FLLVDKAGEVRQQATTHQLLEGVVSLDQQRAHTIADHIATASTWIPQPISDTFDLAHRSLDVLAMRVAVRVGIGPSGRRSCHSAITLRSASSTARIDTMSPAVTDFERKSPTAPRNVATASLT